MLKLSYPEDSDLSSLLQKSLYFFLLISPTTELSTNNSEQGLKIAQRRFVFLANFNHNKEM